MHLKTNKDNNVILDTDMNDDMDENVNDDDDDSSESSESSTTTSYVPEERKDEALELRKLSAQDTRRVRNWRLAVTALLTLTAVVVTSITYILLDDAEYQNFEIAFEQFSRTLGDAAIEQQVNMRDAIEQLSHAVSGFSSSTNATWPFVMLPYFESYGQDFLKLSRGELVGLDIIVKHNDRDAFVQNFTNLYSMGWVNEGHMLAYGNLDKLNPDPNMYNPFISRRTPDGQFVPDMDREMFFVNAVRSPPARAYGPTTNYNKGSIPPIAMLLKGMLQLKNESLISAVMPIEVLPPDEHKFFHTDSEVQNPHSLVHYPIHKVVHDTNSEIVGMINSAFAWDASMLSLLPDNVLGIYCVVQNTCNQSYSYRVDGKDAFFQGDGDHHDPKFDSMKVDVNLALYTHPNFTTTPGHCRYSMSIYPTQTFEKTYKTSTPKVFAAVITSTFVVVIFVFWMYDVMVSKRNEQLLANAARSNAIVASMFPGKIRDRLIGTNADTRKTTTKPVVAASKKNNKKTKKDLKTFMAKGKHNNKEIDIIYNRNCSGMDKTKEQQQEEEPPLADLFLEATVLYADISGFTAWSSMREPSQVFILLETLFGAFDQVANRRGVYKIETVGDCYVAATGIPNVRRDHAVAMSRFARDIMSQMHSLTKELEVKLGPDTGDLTLRIGIHSGPVTAGILRGERARFQLFGDTVNTTARIESSGQGNRIHVSQETADLIMKAGKASWLHKRESPITCKGKAQIQTYWLTPSKGDQGSVISGSNHSSGKFLGDIARTIGGFDEKTSRLIQWNVEELTKSIKQIIARRNFQHNNMNVSDDNIKDKVDETIYEKQQSFLDEVKEIIVLPEYDQRSSPQQQQQQQQQQDPSKVEIPAIVTEQLTEYVTCIAGMYRDNPFHNFEHASHVNMSVMKLLSRIVAPANIDVDSNDNTQVLHDHTYGITSDPLTQFACSFSALIHDVDHVGVPNATLVKENSYLATFYNGRSVAEQNSLSIAWDLLMDERFRQLRSALYSSTKEFTRFRELVVNAVMATDIVDKDLKLLRNNRWDKAFKGSDVEEHPRDAVNRKATIVIEHLIQASDVSHTMQHWHIYRRWNENFFRENYQMFLDGRSDVDPSLNWYKGEIGFFDFYIIPLAKKLKDCGIFGKSSDEYLNYALNNRREWEERGQEVVAEMLQNARRDLSPRNTAGDQLTI